MQMAQESVRFCCYLHSDRSFFRACATVKTVSINDFYKSIFKPEVVIADFAN